MQKHKKQYCTEFDGVSYKPYWVYTDLMRTVSFLLVSINIRPNANVNFRNNTTTSNLRYRESPRQNVSEAARRVVEREELLEPEYEEAEMDCGAGGTKNTFTKELTLHRF